MQPVRAESNEIIMVMMGDSINKWQAAITAIPNNIHMEYMGNTPTIIHMMRMGS